MSDKKTTDKKILLKHTNEGMDQLSTLQEEFDALLSEKVQQPSATEIDGKLLEKVQQPSVTEIDGKLSTLHASEFEINTASAAELAKNIRATFGDHTIVIVGDHTVINEETKSDNTVNTGNDQPSQLKADSMEAAQCKMEADALQQRKHPVSESTSTVIKPRAFAREISPEEIAAFESVKHGKIEGKVISDTLDSHSKATHTSEKSAPPNDSAVFSSMQNELDALEHEPPAAESFPEWEPIPTEPLTDAGAEGIADQVTEGIPDEAMSSQQVSAFNTPENKAASAESFPEWEPMPADFSAESRSEETLSPAQASKSDVSEHEMVRAKNTASKMAWFAEPLIMMCRKARALYSKHSVKDIYNKLPEWKSMPSESPADTSAESEAEQASEAASEEASAPQSLKEIWTGIIFIVFSLAAISLVLWQIVGSFTSDVKVTTHAPGGIERPQPATQIQAVTAQQPDQIDGEQLSDTTAAKPGKEKLASASDTAEEILKPETTPAAKPAVKATKPVTAAVKEEKQPLSTLASKPSTAPAVKLAKAAPAIPDAVRSIENWAVALSSVDSEKTAIQQQARLRATGIEAEYIRTVKNGKAWFFIQIGGFSNKQEAEKQGNILAKKLNTQVSWIDQPKTNLE